MLLNRPIRLDPVSLKQQLVHARRGGGCFQQNGLLLEALAQHFGLHFPAGTRCGPPGLPGPD